VETKNDLKNSYTELKDDVQKISEQEWKLFIDEMQDKIREDEKMLDKLKAKTEITGKKLDEYYLRQIDQLEQKFNNLQERMKKSERRQADWTAFKTEFNRDMLKMKEALKDLTD